MISINRSGIAGSYLGVRQQARLELRLDVGEPDSLDIVSGDLFFETNAGSFEFHHSFQTTALALEEETSGMVIPDAQLLRGPVKVHRDDIVDIGRLDLSIPQTGDLVAVYTLYRLTSFGRQTVVELTFSLQRVSSFFRPVDVEIESVSGVPFPRPFQTSNHPDTPISAQNQTLTLRSVYSAAGIDLNVVHGREEIPVNEAGIDGRWTEEELHAAMVAHFDQHRDAPQWHLYLLLATEFREPSVLGIMFDAADNGNFHRQGAAVFHDHPNIGKAGGVEKDREYLFTIVHELGHAFNFLHSFQKGLFEAHGVLPRPDAMSWMNYPQLYPYGYAGPPKWDGSDQFWSQFEFNFDGDEIHHLRHDDRFDVIPGGMSFGFAGHFEERPFARPTRTSGLRLDLWTPATVEFLQQVEGDVRLLNESGLTVRIPPSLDPATGHLELLVQRPKDRLPKVYQRFATTCVRAAARELRPSDAIYQEISPSYARRQWFIDEPGTYILQAVLKMPEGSRVVSNVQRLRVLTPDRKADQLAADFFNDDTGIYFDVEGSRCSRLQKTRDALNNLIEEISESTIAKQIRLTNALRDTRIFKDVAGDRVVRPNRSKAATSYLQAIGASEKRQIPKLGEGFSNLRLTRALISGARGCAAEDNQDDARRIFGIVDLFMKSVKAPDSARTQAKEIAKSMGL